MIKQRLRKTKAYVELARDSAMKYGIPLTLDTV